MSIYIISNRSIIDGNKFSNKGTERAKREFRVAEAEVLEEEKKVTYKILDDFEVRGYAQVKDFLEGNSALNELAGTAYLFADLYKQMLAVKDQQSDCLFFIHGFANTFEDSLENIWDLHNTYIKPKTSGIDHLVYVAWPSIGSRIGTYSNDQEDAEETGRILGALFSKLIRFFVELFETHSMERCTNRIHLAAHSMGNTVLDYMLQNIPDHKLFHIFGEVLLLNADVPFDIFEPNKSFRKFKKLASRTHIYISRSDEVLSVISTYTKNFVRRLGHKGPLDLNTLNEETFVVDTTDAGRASSFLEKTLDHWGYLKRKAVINDIIEVLAGTDENNILGRERENHKKNYFSLK